jgi:hypothetical protein
MDQTPAEQRRGYMLQPMTILTMQSFLEKVLETEGITKEMIERQQKQAELLNTLATADPDVVDYLIKERGKEIDATFFAMLKSYIDTAAEMNDNEMLLPLINLQAKLMTETEAGREVEKQQIALHALNRDAKAAGGLTPAILVEHVIKNKDNPALIEAIAQVGLGGMNYEFFAGLSAEIERLEEAGDTAAAANLTDIRTDLLELQEQVQNQTQQMLGSAKQTLESMLAAEDMQQELQAHMDVVDDAFMYVLAAEMSQAEEAGDDERLGRINMLRDLIVEQIEGQTPPELRLLNKLVRAESEAEMVQLIAASPDLISADLVKVVDALQDQIRPSGQAEMIDRLGQIKALITAQLA